MSCSKCILDWLIRMHVWWSRCTDRYQLWDKPFSKVNNRRKKLLCQTFFLCVGTFLQSSVRNNVSCMYVCFFYLAFSQSRSTFICLLVSFFLECVYVWFLCMECCLVFSEICLYLVFGNVEAIFPYQNDMYFRFDWKYWNTFRLRFFSTRLSNETHIQMRFKPHTLITVDQIH